jgi:hypothetical protein
MFRSLHYPVQIVIENLGMVIILIQVIFFCHLQFERIIGTLKDLIEIIGLAIFRGLKIGAGTEDCKQDYYERKWFHEGGEITIFR